MRQGDVAAKQHKKFGSDKTNSPIDLQLALQLEGARTLLDEAGNRQQEAVDRAVQAEGRIRVCSTG